EREGERGGEGKEGKRRGGRERERREKRRRGERGERREGDALAELEHPLVRGWLLPAFGQARQDVAIAVVEFNQGLDEILFDD
ncbi:hypothetical protein ACC734_39135, partial [Rhizobium ruizarguesonis]